MRTTFAKKQPVADFFSIGGASPDEDSASRWHISKIFYLWPYTQNLSAMKRAFFLLLVLLGVTVGTLSAQTVYQLSSHILDISTGAPAPGVTIRLERLSADSLWTPVAERQTDADGRVRDFLPVTPGQDNRGIYKLVYLTRPYFTARGQQSFYPFIEVVFEVSDSSHYHVPITLSPFGYSTYRGS